MENKKSIAVAISLTKKILKCCEEFSSNIVMQLITEISEKEKFTFSIEEISNILKKPNEFTKTHIKDLINNEVLYKSKSDNTYSFSKKEVWVLAK